MHDSEADAANYGLVYVSDDMPGIRRRRRGAGFRYLEGKNVAVSDPATLKRIQSLAIPPAWKEVWICPTADGHIQATGRDARGRKQYRYHPQWTALRGANKFQQLEEFGNALPRIRRSVKRDMRRRGTPHQKMVAVLVRLLELTLVRIGSEQYAKNNHSYGLTTLRRRHASVAGTRVRLRFKGKSGVQHDITVNDKQIATVLKRCLEIPGQELFQYRSKDGKISSISSGCVNDYLKKAADADFTARHYRTWAASVYMLRQLQRAAADNSIATQAVLVRAIKKTASRLGNTPAVCRKCYIHPGLFTAYTQGQLPPVQALPSPAGLSADERRFLAFLKQINRSSPKQEPKDESMDRV